VPDLRLAWTSPAPPPIIEGNAGFLFCIPLVAEPAIFSRELEGLLMVSYALVNWSDLELRVPDDGVRRL
jgi:hypothetical protein